MQEMLYRHWPHISIYCLCKSLTKSNFFRVSNCSVCVCVNMQFLKETYLQSHGYIGDKGLGFLKKIGQDYLPRQDAGANTISS